jgi:hypothetical protein
MMRVTGLAWQSGLEVRARSTSSHRKGPAADNGTAILRWDAVRCLRRIGVDIVGASSHY